MNTKQLQTIVTEQELDDNRSMTPTPSIIEMLDPFPHIHDKGSINSMCGNTIKIMLTFMDAKDISNFSVTSKFHWTVTKQHSMKSVENIAYLDPRDDTYHIKPIKSKSKYYNNKMYLLKMSDDEKKDESGDNVKEYLLESFIHQTFEWYVLHYSLYT